MYIGTNARHTLLVNYLPTNFSFLVHPVSRDEGVASGYSFPDQSPSELSLPPCAFTLQEPVSWSHLRLTRLDFLTNQCICCPQKIFVSKVQLLRETGPSFFRFMHPRRLFSRSPPISVAVFLFSCLTWLHVWPTLSNQTACTVGQPWQCCSGYWWSKKRTHHCK